MTREKKLESILVITAGLLLMYFVFKLNGFLIAALVLALLSSVSNVFVTAITWLWFKLSDLLGWINTRILLALVFYFLLFPIAFIAKLLKRDALKLKQNKASAYTERNHVFTAGDLENTW